MPPISDSIFPRVFFGSLQGAGQILSSKLVPFLPQTMSSVESKGSSRLKMPLLPCLIPTRRSSPRVFLTSQFQFLRFSPQNARRFVSPKKANIKTTFYRRGWGMNVIVETLLRLPTKKVLVSTIIMIFFSGGRRMVTWYLSRAKPERLPERIHVRQNNDAALCLLHFRCSSNYCGPS